jgi:hypothetical protein
MMQSLQDWVCGRPGTASRKPLPQWRQINEKRPTPVNRPHSQDHNRAYCPQHFLYFFPLPQGQGSLRPTFGEERKDCGVDLFRDLS